MKGIYLVGVTPVIVVVVVFGLLYNAQFSTTQGAASTTLTVGCAPVTVDKTGLDITTISGYLKGGGVGVSGKMITISYSADGISYSTIGTCDTDGTGYYSLDWDVPADFPNGKYFIKSEFAGDTAYLASSAQTGEDDSLFVVPEYPLGSIAGLIAIFAAFAVFKKLGHSKNISR